MGFFISTLAFGAVSLLCFILAVYIYFRLLIAVCTFKKLPKWIYTLGHIRIWVRYSVPYPHQNRGKGILHPYRFP